MRILLVDDDTNLLKVLSAILNAKGMETLSAETGTDALSHFDGQEIDVVLIDLKLEGSSGLEVMRSIKAQSADTECILLTGYASQASAIEAINLGAFAYFQKPYNIDQLLLAIKRAGERRAMEQALRESEERFRRLAENARDLIYRYEFIPQRGFSYVSPAATVITGYTPEEHYADPDLGFKLVHPDDRPLIEAATQIETLPSQSLVLRWVRKDGETIWTEQRNVPIFDDEGNLLALEGIARDITERKQMEDALRQRMVELETLYTVSTTLRTTQTVEEATPIVLDATLAALNAGAGAVGLYDPANDMLHTAIQRGWFRQLDMNPMGLDEGIGGKVIRSRQTYVVEDFRTDPNVRSFEPSKIPPGWGGACVPILSDEDIIGVLYVSMPHPQRLSSEQLKLLESVAELAGTTLRRIGLIGETKSLLRQTQAQAQRTQQIIDTIPEGVLVVDEGGGFVQANPTALTYLPQLASLAPGDPVTCPGDKPVTDQLPAADPQQPWHEMSWGEPPRIYESAAQPLGDAPRPEGWVMILRDVTDERERQRYQQSQENLASLGQMAAGIAHDFNNILGSILLFIELLRRGSEFSEKQSAYLTSIYTQSQYAADLVRQILDFGRRAIMEKSTLDLLALIDKSIRLLKRTLPESIHLTLSCDRSEYLIFADPTRLQQMLINLVLNARDAMPNGGNLALTLSTLTLAPDQPLPLPDMAPGNWLRLDVADTGTGIDPAHLPHLFQPFFTTKEVGKGTGLGLAQVYGIVMQHNGAISAASHLGEGTTFSVYLPLPKTVHAKTPPQEETFPLPSGAETILVTEDNEAIRMAIGETLGELGYVILSAANGIEALEILETQAQTISLLLSDMVMPEMGGLELAQIGSHRHPGLKTIIMSGHPLTQSQDALRKVGILDWIQKPFDIDTLAQQIRDTLDSL